LGRARPHDPASVLGAGVRGPLDRLDPRARVLGAVVWAVGVVALSDLAALAAAAALAAGLTVAAGVPCGALLRRVAALDGFLLAAVATLPFSTPGAPAAEVLGLTATREGLRLAAEIALTANAAALAAIALVGALDPVAFGRALGRLGAPPALAQLTAFALRYVDVLAQEGRRLRAAMKARGFRPGPDGRSLRAFGWLVGMTLVRALDRSDRILDAMKCRGYDGRAPAADGPPFGPADALFGAGVAAALVGLHAAQALR
jgi:cobalt/nickel transport system permease protein